MGKVCTMTDERQPRSRTRILVAAVVVAVLLSGVAVACSSADDGSTATDEGTSASTGGTTGERPIGPAMSGAWSGVRTDGDGLVIVFLGNPAVGDRSGDASGGCQSDYQGIAAETDQAVTVTIYGTHVEECPNQIQYGRTVRVALDAPLGPREVRNGSGGDPELVFDGARLLHPTWLPDGWEQTRDMPERAGHWGGVRGLAARLGPSSQPGHVLRGRGQPDRPHRRRAHAAARSPGSRRSSRSPPRPSVGTRPSRPGTSRPRTRTRPPRR